MATADYKLCDVCGRKAFYDANVGDPHYVATWDASEGFEPIGIAVLCSDCNKTHEAIVRPRASSFPPPGSEAEAEMVERAYAEYRRSREGCAPCLDDFFRASMLTCLRAALLVGKEGAPDA